MYLCEIYRYTHNLKDIMNHGFVKVAAAVPRLKVTDCRYNVEQIKQMTTEASSKEVEILTFPELCITGYSCGDLFMQQALLDGSLRALKELLSYTRELDMIILVGMPLSYNNILLNVAIALQRGKILGVVPKIYLPTYKEFYEQRWFNSGAQFPEAPFTLCGQETLLSPQLLFDTPDTCFAIELCEDVWAPIPPSSTLALQGAEIIFNLSASNEVAGKHKYVSNLVQEHSARCLCGYVYTSSGFGESSTDVVYGGNSMIFENGELLSSTRRFSMEPQLIISDIDVERLRMERRLNTTFADNIYNLHKVLTHKATAALPPRERSINRTFNPLPFLPGPQERDEMCDEIINIQSTGLATRLAHTGIKKVVVGISGGLDSTLALLVCTKAFDKMGLPRNGILGITMPGFGTSGRTHANALKLMSYLGVTQREISIKEACTVHFKDIGHDINVQDTTYENSQARERTQILMDVANQENALVIGTGDLSELALGWATYNGDHMSMYSVNASIPKTLVRYLVGWLAQQMGEEVRTCLMDVIDTPVSPELTPADKEGNIKQKTEDLVGPYELHDFFLYHFMRYGYRPAKIYFLARTAFKGKFDEATIKKWIKVFYRRFFGQQFKRSCLPDGPKATPVSLSPRGDWRMPSDAGAALWLEECDLL